MTHCTPTPAPTPCANTMRRGLREAYVSLKTLIRAYAVGVFALKVPTRCAFRAETRTRELTTTAR